MSSHVPEFVVITLAAVVVYSGYVVFQIQRLRQLQSDLLDRNRKDSLQLLRIQNDLNSLGLAMRDMLDSEEPYPLTAWTAQFARIRGDLESALAREAQVATGRRTPESQCNPAIHVAHPRQPSSTSAGHPLDNPTPPTSCLI